MSLIFSLSWFICPSAGSTARLSFQYLPHCSERDVFHNSRFSHVVYSLTLFSLFFPPVSLIPSPSHVNDWSGTDRPPLRSVLLQHCPLLSLLFPFPVSFTSIHLSLGDSLCLFFSINHFTVCACFIIPEWWFCLVLIGCQGVWETVVLSLLTVHFSPHDVMQKTDACLSWNTSRLIGIWNMVRSQCRFRGFG